MLVAVAAGSAPVLADTDNKFHGSVESSLTFFQGNRNTDSIFVVAKAKQDNGSSRLGFSGFYNWARQTPVGGGPYSVTSDQWNLSGRYERDQNANLFWYFSAAYDRDGVNLLNLRQVYGAGAGYTVTKSAVSTWRVSVGASQVYENFVGSSNSYFGIQFASDYERKITNKLSVDHNFLYVPNASAFGDYFYLSSLGLTYNLNDHMSAGFRWIFTFDSTPAAGSVNQTKTYAFTLGYRF